MANEITTNLRVQIANGTLSVDFNPGRIQATQTTLGYFDRVATITTSETTVALTGITTPGIAVIYNLDATNFVEVGTTTADYPIKLMGAGIPTITRLNAGKTTLYLKANTASCKVRILVFEA